MKRIMNVVLFRKGEYGKTTHKKINVLEFQKLIKSPELQSDLVNGRLLGLFTHSDRNSCRTKPGAPVADNVANSEDLATKVLSIYETPSDFQAELEVLDTPKGERFVELTHSGTKFCVSMSTESDPIGDEYFVRKLWGVDITLLPEFTSDITAVNFSQQNTITNPNYITSNDIQYVEFSIKDYIRERTVYTPSLVLKNRILEVIRYINMNKPTAVQKDKDTIRSYITEYLKEYIGKAVRSSDNINLIMNLRLNMYLVPNEMREIRKLQAALNKAKSTLNDDGTILKQQQVIIEETFNILIRAIFDYIDEKVGNPDKAISDPNTKILDNSSDDGKEFSQVEELILDSDLKKLSQYDFSAIDFEVFGDPHMTELLSENDYPGVIHYREISTSWNPDSTKSMDSNFDDELVYSTEIPLHSLIGTSGVYLAEGDEIPSGLSKALHSRGITKDYILNHEGDSLYDLLDQCQCESDADNTLNNILANKDRYPLAYAQSTDFGLKRLSQRIKSFFNQIKKPPKINDDPVMWDSNHPVDDVPRPTNYSSLDINNNNNNNKLSREKQMLSNWDKKINIPESLLIDSKSSSSKKFNNKLESGGIKMGMRQDRNPNLNGSVGGDK
jgi:hypothetical protein